MAEGSQAPYVAIALGLIAAAAPFTAAVHGWVSKARDLELAERDHVFKTQSWFLQNAVDPQKTPELRQQVLRFITTVQVADQTLVGWANGELKRVDEIVELRKQLALSQNSERALLDQLHEEQKRAAPDAKPRSALVEQVEKAKQESSRIEKKLVEKDPAQFNLQYLQMQSQLQTENARLTTISELMKKRQDAELGGIQNIR